jgi:hypothetical protein
MLITLAFIAAGAFGLFVAGRKAEKLLASRRQDRLKELEPGAFQRLCDECHVAVGSTKEGGEKGEWLNGQLLLGGLLYTSTHSLPVGRLIAAQLSSGDCRYCKLRMYVLFEIAEKDGKDGKKESFPRVLCSVCPSLQCGVIERNGGYTYSARYGALIESSDNMHSFLIELLERQRNAPFEALSAPPTPLALPPGDKAT